MNKLNTYKRQIFDIIEIGNKNQRASKAFDIFIVIAIICNITATLMRTFDELSGCADILGIVETTTFIIFTIEYILRLWTADMLFPGISEGKSRVKFLISFFGIVDLMTLLPFYFPGIFPAGMVAFRIFRVIRIFRLFRVSTLYDSFDVIEEVIREKRSQIASSVCLILMLMLASSLCMYSLEHEAQPEVFRNGFSAIWWSVSTMLTVGYGDIYPITMAGKIMAIVISFLGVGMVAIPTGIISAGFVEQYTKIKVRETENEERDCEFAVSDIGNDSRWAGKRVKETVLPPQLVLLLIIRDRDIIVPQEDTVLISGDRLVIGTRAYSDKKEIDLKEIIIKKDSPWIGVAIEDIDISRHDIIAAIQRNGRIIFPGGNTVIRAEDRLIVLHKSKRR